MRISRLMLTAGALAAAVFAGCDEKSPEPASQSERPAQADKAVDAYSVRGVVAQLPVEGDPSKQLMIRHEEIPDFKDRTGAVVGMNAMQMPFPVGEGVSLDGISIGDKVTFEFVVETDVWTFYVTEIEKLDPSTELAVP